MRVPARYEKSSGKHISEISSLIEERVATGPKRLWIAVLYQALCDLDPPTNWHEEVTHKSARRFFKNKYSTLRDICEYLDISHHAVVERFYKGEIEELKHAFWVMMHKREL